MILSSKAPFPPNPILLFIMLGLLLIKKKNE